MIRRREERRPSWLRLASLRMLNKASTNRRLCDSVVHQQPRSNIRRERLRKGHLSCLTVSTISRHRQTCTVTLLLEAGPSVGGGGVGWGHPHSLNASWKYRCAKWPITLCDILSSGGWRRGNGDGRRKGALQFQTLSFDVLPDGPH